MEKIHQPDLPYIYKRLSELEGLVQLLLSQPAGHEIEDENGALPQRSRLRFIGIGKRITDNSGDDVTTVDVSSPAIVGQVVMDDNGDAFDVVTVDGKIADQSQVTHAGRVAGIAITAPEAGFPVDIIFHGDLENPAWSFTEGDILFLTANGKLTTVAPGSGFSQVIGSAKSPTKILVNLEEPILL